MTRTQHLICKLEAKHTALNEDLEAIMVSGTNAERRKIINAQTAIEELLKSDLMIDYLTTVMI